MSTRCRLDLTWNLQPDPQLTTAGEMVNVPCLLPQDRQLSLAVEKIEELVKRLRREESAKEQIARMQARIEATRKYVQDRKAQLSKQIACLEQRWISELHSREKQIIKSRRDLHQKSRRRKDERTSQEFGTHLAEKRRKIDNTRSCNDDQEFYGGVCEITDNYKKSIASLSAAISALDGVIRFPGALQDKQFHAEVTAVRQTLCNSLCQLRSQLNASAGTGTPRIPSPIREPSESTSFNETTDRTPTSTSKGTVSPRGPPSTMSDITLPFASPASSSNSNVSSSVQSSSTTSTTESIDATQKSQTSLNNSSTDKSSPQTTELGTASSYVSLPKPEKGAESVRLAITPNQPPPPIIEANVVKNEETPKQNSPQDNKPGNEKSKETAQVVA